VEGEAFPFGGGEPLGEERVGVGLGEERKWEEEKEEVQRFHEKIITQRYTGMHRDSQRKIRTG
jgi:hypothetical protein